jgi:hypothetical protein
LAQNVLFPAPGGADQERDDEGGGGGACSWRRRGVLREGGRGIRGGGGVARLRGGVVAREEGGVVVAVAGEVDDGGGVRREGGGGWRGGGGQSGDDAHAARRALVLEESEAVAEPQRRLLALADEPSRVRVRGGEPRRGVRAEARHAERRAVCSERRHLALHARDLDLLVAREAQARGERAPDLRRNDRRRGVRGGGERQRRAVARHDERHRRGRRTRPKP